MAIHFNYATLCMDQMFTHQPRLLPDFYEYCTCDLREYSLHKHIQHTWYLPWCHAEHFNLSSNSIFFYCFSCNTHSFCSLFLSLFLFLFCFSFYLAPFDKFTYACLHLNNILSVSLVRCLFHSNSIDCQRFLLQH